MDENIVNFIGGYATAIKEEIIKVSPHVVIGENILNDILAIIYVLGDYANMNNADGRKKFENTAKKLLQSTMDEESFQYEADRIGFYGSVLNKQIAVRGDSFQVSFKKNELEDPIYRLVVAFCDCIYNLNCLYYYPEAPELKREQRVDNKEGSAILKGLKRLFTLAYNDAKTLWFSVADKI